MTYDPEITTLMQVGVKFGHIDADTLVFKYTTKEQFTGLIQGMGYESEDDFAYGFEDLRGQWFDLVADRCNTYPDEQVTE